MHQLPAFTPHLHVEPLVDQNSRHHIRQQHIAAGQFLAFFEMLNAQAQLVEFGRRFFQYPHGQARGQNLIVNHTFGDQLQATGQGHGIAARVFEPRQQGALQGFARLVEPGRLIFLKSHPGIAPVLHFAHRTCDIQYRNQVVFTNLDQIGKRTAHVNHKEFACLFGQ